MASPGLLAPDRREQAETLAGSGTLHVCNREPWGAGKCVYMCHIKAFKIFTNIA